MTEFFRFRSIDSLLGKHQELKDQTIFFASPDELNDPMEGLRNIVWNGDQIVWTNFFKHYIFCLNRCYLPLNITPKPRKLEVDSIPILERWDQITPPIEKTLFDDIWDRFFNLPYIQEIIEALSSTSYKNRYREIVYYLQWIQTPILIDEIREAYADHGVISEPLISPPFEVADVSARMAQLLSLITNVEAIENESTRDAILQSMVDNHDDIQLIVENYTRTHRPEILEDMNRILMPDFPRVYVEQLDRLLWPKWYTACFTESYHNSSVWAKYADEHKGTCLIFEAVENNDSTSLKLNHITSNSSIPLPFRKVNYGRGPSEIDFFRTICRNITVSMLKELWYTDQNGNISECAAHLESDQSQAAWGEDYWNNFFRDVTFKTKDWEYEQEYRLIINNKSGQFDKRDDRKLTYGFDSLKGIIFGMRTSTEDKLKIVEIIKEKIQCDRNNQADFKFYEADYSSEDGKIHRRERQLG